MIKSEYSQQNAQPHAGLKKNRSSQSGKAGLVFPVARVHQCLRAGRHSTKVGKTASVYMAAVLEYLTREMLEEAGNTARQMKRKRLVPKHILHSIQQDRDMKELLAGVTVSGGGVSPGPLHPSLLPKKKVSANKIKQKKVGTRKTVPKKRNGKSGKKTSKVNNKKKDSV